MERWRFIINKDLTDPREIFPTWDQDLIFDDAPESGQAFLRTKMRGELLLTESDFDYVMAADLETTFFVDVAELQPDGASYVSVFQGKFNRTDCDIDEDSSQLSVELEASDAYRLLMEAMDREFNLIDLAPAITQLNYVTRPVVQILSYISGSPSAVLTNIYGGIQYEQDLAIDAPFPILDPLVDTYHFGFLGDRIIMISDDFDPVIPTEYVSEGGFPFPEYSARSLDGTHAIRFNVGLNIYELIIVSSGVVLYTLGAGESFIGGTWTSTLSGKQAESTVSTFWGRMIVGKDTVGVTAAELLPEEDIVSSSVLYTHAIPLGTAGASVGVYGTHWQEIIIGSFENTEDPDKYEVIPDDADFFPGNYFNKPSGYGTNRIHPLQQSLWGLGSYWFTLNDEVAQLELDGRTDRLLKHAYKWEDVMTAMLNEIDPSLTFIRSDTNSDFLYGSTNPIRIDGLYPMITPKSNILVGEYNEPAQRAPVRLQDLLNLAENFWRCKIYISGGDLIQEHEEFFDKGLSYTTDQVGLDLSTVVDPSSGLPWAYKTAKYNYDKANIPGRYEPKWMDQTSQIFDGVPIQIRSKFADLANTQQKPVQRFTSDIDFAQISPENLSKDGFFFFEALQDGSGDFYLPFVTLTLDGEEFEAQNGYAAFVYAHENYWPYQLPAPLITINNIDQTAISVMRNRIQEIQGPSDGSYDLLNLITSTLGNGRIRSAQRRLDQGGISFRLAHKNE